MKEKSRNLHFIYAILDVLLSFGIVFVSFLSYYGFNNIGDNIVSTLIYSGSVALATFLLFLVTKNYKIITRDIGIFESIRITLVTLGVHLIGLIVIAFVDALPVFKDFIFIWMLSTISLMFLHPTLRLLVRVFNLTHITFFSYNRKYCRKKCFSYF